MQKPGSRILREEAKRKAIHVCGTAIPVLYLFLQKDLIIRGFVIGLFAVLIIEWSRLRGLISLPFLRHGEEKKKEIGAYVFFVIGAFISVIVFEKSIAIAAILMLAIGDTVSALAGAVIIADKPGMYRKSLKPPEVMLSMFTTSLLIGWLVLHSLPMSLFGALGATIADSVPLKVHGVPIDDNLTIPLFSGVLMSFVSMLLVVY